MTASERRLVGEISGTQGAPHLTRMNKSFSSPAVRSYMRSILAGRAQSICVSTFASLGFSSRTGVNGNGLITAPLCLGCMASHHPLSITKACKGVQGAHLQP